MVTAKKEAAITMRSTDVVIEVLDARVPKASRNPMIEKIRRDLNRPALKILNKADIADPKRTADWLAFYNAQPNMRAIAVTASKQGDVLRIPKECLQLAPTRTSASKPLRMMILGIPNVGKSTLMNSLLKRHVAKVGDEPAITKQQQRHELGRGMSIVDTPGMTWPGISAQVGTLLAATNSIGRNAYDDENIAIALADYLLVHYPQALSQRYGASGATGHASLELVAKRRSFIVKGGGFDMGKAATALLTDFRQGTLGRISLEEAPVAEPEVVADDGASDSLEVASDPTKI